MGINFIHVSLGLALSLGTFMGKASAAPDPYLAIHQIKIQEIIPTGPGQERIEVLSRKGIVPGIPGLPTEDGQIKPEPGERLGKIISIGKDLVALGEDLYRLVSKGKPSNETSYAPISIVPKVAGVPADIFDTEGWRVPSRKTFEVVYENRLKMEVVKFRYSVIYAYGGSYEGKGAYLTAVQIVPEYVNTLFGFHFTATMKLGGIQNNGTKANPVAAATLLMEYTISTIIQATVEVSTFHVTGNGYFRNL